MKPALRYLLAGLAWVVAGALALNWVLHEQASEAAAQHAADRLARVAVVATDVRDNAVQQLQLRAAALAGDPAFADYVVQSMQPGAAPDGGIDRASILDLLKSRRSGYDLAAVLDARGEPVALDGKLPVAAASLPQDPLVAETLATLKPSTGAWARQGQLLWVTVNPLLRGGIAQGLLLTAARVDNDYAATVARHTGTEVAVLAADDRDYALASAHALPAWAELALPEVAAGLPATLPLPASDLELPGVHRELARVLPLPTASGHAIVVALAEPATGRAVAWPPLVFALLGGLVVLWHWWRVERPLQWLTDRVAGVARGRRPPEFPAHGGVAVRRLARHLNRLFEHRPDL